MLISSSRSVVLVLLVAVAAVNAAPGFKPNSSIVANTWTNANEKWFLYPEQDANGDYYVPNMGKRPNFGIAVSGGGYRAVTLALGYVRALYMMNLTQQARYLASNSGGSWFNSAFSYQHTIPVETFIGPYVPPQNLTRDNLKDAGKGAQGAFAATISNAVIIANALAGAAKDTIAQSDKGPGAWSDSVGNAFLAPYELNNDKSTFTANGTKAPIHQALAGMEGLKVYPWEGAVDPNSAGNISRPFPIILGSLFNRVDNMSLYYPCEFTPEYIGIPPVFPAEQPNRTIGGGLVDTFGFNSFPPEVPPQVPPPLKATLGKVPPGYGVLPKSTKGKRLRQLLQTPGSVALAPAPGSATGTTAVNGGAAGGAKKTGPGAGIPAAALANNGLLPLQTELNSSFVVPLKVAAGISSSFLAQGLAPAESDALKEMTGTEELEYWNKVNFKGMKQAFADGGGTDNLAVTPLLRRKVEYIVSCVAASEGIFSDTKSDDWALSQWDIAALFGAVPLNHPKMKGGMVNRMPPQVFNRVTQVFPKSAWTSVFNGLKKTGAAGGPAYHLGEYTVMDNPYQAVHGGWKVKVLFVVNAVEHNWEKQLPENVLDPLNAARKKKGGLYSKEETKKDAAPEAEDAKGWGPAELKNYPFISTFNADYSPELTGLLSQQATWQMLELRPQLQKMLTGSGVKVGPVKNVGQATEDKNIGVPSKNLKSSAMTAGGAGVWRPVLAAVLAAVLAPFMLAA